MCPPIPGLALLNISISGSWSDEELVRFLAERKAGDPLPQNVLVGMNFSLIDPRVSSGNIWYLNWSDDQHTYDNGENAIRNAENGYWKSVDALRIPTSTDIVGVKISLQFYEGQAPSGQRTGWVMHEYQVEQNDEANTPQDYKSLCTIFLQGDKKLNVEDQRISRNANAPNDRLESYLQYLAEIEEQNAAMNSEIVASNQQNFSPSKGQDEHKTHNASDAIAFHRALANEAYIETNDLLSSDPTASTSEYSSRRSMISEEYFDSDAFLREILNDSNTTDEEHKDCKFSISAPTNSDLVVISLPEQGSKMLARKRDGKRFRADVRYERCTRTLESIVHYDPGDTSFGGDDNAINIIKMDKERYKCIRALQFVYSIVISQGNIIQVHYSSTTTVSNIFFGFI